MDGAENRYITISSCHREQLFAPLRLAPVGGVPASLFSPRFAVAHREQLFAPLRLAPVGGVPASQFLPQKTVNAAGLFMQA